MVRIYGDSTCDLNEELKRKYNIGIIPLYVSLGEKTGKDGIDITPEAIYRWADEHKDTPKTSAFSTEDAADIINECKNSGDDMIFMGISESMSASCNVVRLAAQACEYDDHVYVVNSQNLSTGIGLVLLEAAKLVMAGESAPDIVDRLNDIIPRVRASFVVNTLTYLHRGGRCSAVTALLANTLKLKPKIAVKDGNMDVAGKYRGKLRQVLLRYAEDMRDDLLQAEKSQVFITHTEMDKDIVDEVRKYLESLDYFENITETIAGSVVTSHCGPGTLGVLFISKV